MGKGHNIWIDALHPSRSGKVHAPERDFKVHLCFEDEITKVVDSFSGRHPAFHAGSPREFAKEATA
jgi:hypothetical protein